MGLAVHSFQLNSTTVCEHRGRQKGEERGKSGLGIENALYPSALCPLACRLPSGGRIATELHKRPTVAGSSSVDSLSVNDDEAQAGGAPAANVSSSGRGFPGVPMPSNTSSSSSQAAHSVNFAGGPEYPFNGETGNTVTSPKSEDLVDLSYDPVKYVVNGESDDDRQDISSVPVNVDEYKKTGKIRRFSLNEPGLVKILQDGRDLSPLEKSNMKKILTFKRVNNYLKGRLVIRALRVEQMKDVEILLTDSYAELMWGPLTYKPALAWVLSTYLRERQACLPHAVTLVGLYEPSENTKSDIGSKPKWCVSGAVEISFNSLGKPKNMQTPLPPEDAPFMSNMAVSKTYRRRGIGRELLKAAEELVLQLGGHELYLHCRMIDEAPLTMYTKSGYSVVATDNVFSLLLFQRRKHLMYKRLEAPVHIENQE
ncbi:hypothetical protein KP509_18G033200 [Ceratopteris richardii]|uniref:N-acetyltransferase domain-containing protein n=1 Tax=Ceratopteris richardii TaxID=49495 RepID=A0A8T2SNI9_CERRI|nr:hypothetical protein KP509_18G033200 [Ceratopteris richardii]